MTDPIIWRGLSFFLSPESHRGYERWDSEAQGPYGRPQWAAECFGDEEWYARLAVTAYRVTGKGADMRLALDDALERAKELRRAIGKALPK